MQLSITLVNDQLLFWFLPGGKCHLSSDNPGPVEIDFKSLTKEEQKCIILAGRAKTIKLSLHDAELVNEFNGPAENTTVVTQIQKTVIDTINEKTDLLEKELLPILNKSSGSLKKELGLLNDIRKLETLLFLEQKYENRGKIRDLISSRIEYLQTIVSEDIKNTNDENILEQVDPIADSMNVQDSDIKTVEVPLDGDV